MNWRAIVCAVAAAQAVLQGTTADVAAQIFANEPPAMTPNDGVSDFIPAASGSDSSERERAGECLGGGCSNFSVNNPVGTLWTTSSAFITWSTCIHGGDYAFYLVSYGQTYEWSLCPAEGGGGSFDSELSLWDEAGTTPYCYSNDYCGPDARIAWTATLTGVVRVLVSAYPCLSNNICTTLRFRCASCESCIPDFAVTAPGTWSANTCGASNRCDPRPGPEHIYQIVIPTTGVWTFSLCGSTFDTYLYLGTTCCALEMGQNDDSEVCSPQSQLSGWLTAGTYYARIEGHDTSPPNWCGDYTFSVFQCVAACPPGGVPENEPACHTDYDDRTDGGCSWDPQVFWPIANGQTVCGTSGTFLHRAFDNTDPNSAGPYFEFRDTDWYELATTEPMVLTWTAEAEFPVQIRVIDGSCGCALRRTLMSSTVGPCETATLTTECLPPGRYWFWVAPSIFTGVPCGLSYTATLTGVPCALAQPGDMCGNAIPVPGLPYYDTGNTCAYADNYAEACPNVDYTPDVVYAYSPPVNQHITLDLRDSSFDTRLFVYEDACCSPAIACNEGCGTGCPNAAARIECLPVQAGHTYYVVVEGYGGSCGDYVLRVTAARPEIASCPTSRTLPAGPSCQATMPDLTVELVATETCDANLRISQDPPAKESTGCRTVTLRGLSAANSSSRSYFLNTPGMPTS